MYVKYNFYYFPDMISCTRHLSLKSSIVRMSESGEEVRTASESEGESDPDLDICNHDDDDTGDCEECKKRVQIALVDTLPESVQDGMSFRIFTCILS